MRDYTVVLQYPDYVASQYGEEFYVATVQAETPEDAAGKAQSEAAERNRFDDDETLYPIDYMCVVVIAGVHTVLYSEASNL